MNMVHNGAPPSQQRTHDEAKERGMVRILANNTDAILIIYLFIIINYILPCPVPEGLCILHQLSTVVCK